MTVMFDLLVVCPICNTRVLVSDCNNSPYFLERTDKSVYCKYLEPGVL